MSDYPIMMFAVPVTGWWRWFAWYPIKTWDSRWRWFCWVDRRLMVKKPSVPGPLKEWFQHRVAS